MAKSRAMRRHDRAILILMMAYAVLLIAAIYLFTRHLVAAPATYLVALLPALPIIGIFLAIGRYLIEETDEYLRLLMVRQTLIASGFALTIATGWGFLQAFELTPTLESYWIAMLWFIGLGIGSAVNRLTFGSAATC